MTSTVIWHLGLDRNYNGQRLSLRHQIYEHRVHNLTLPFCLKLQSGLTLSSDGILGPLTSDLPAEGLDLSDVPSAEDGDLDVPAAKDGDSDVPTAEDGDSNKMQSPSLY